ncbi:MAG: hypothetical protein IKE76_13410, partial [Clostridia bacterium]|nr:hypothetical protein [Clostridia bacterium]
MFDRLHTKARVALALVLAISMVLCALPAEAFAEAVASDGTVESAGKEEVQTPPSNEVQLEEPKKEEGSTQDPNGSSSSADGLKELTKAQETTDGDPADKPQADVGAAAQAEADDEAGAAKGAAE